MSRLQGRVTRQERSTISITGNTSGLKAQALKSLERLSRRRIRTNQIIAPEVARTLCEVSREIGRQIGLLIDRRGDIRMLVVGDAKSIFLPDLSSFRGGRSRLRGLRLVHTHLGREDLTEDDLTDLALLRLDLVSAIEVEDSGLPGAVHTAHMLPANDEGRPWEVLPATTVHDLPEDFSELISALEDEFARTQTARDARDNRDRAIVIHVSTMNPTRADESMDELRELCRSAGFVVLDSVVQRRNPDAKYVMGRGRLQQSVIRAMQLGAEVLVFDQNLSPAQVKNLADLTDLKVLDRTQVILDIFAQRAETREGKLQVELAQLRYLLPRLSAKHTAMSRLTGGIGGRGPGETKLEIDRRRASDRVAQLQREVNKLGDRRRLRRSRREDKGLPTVAIVGYTNAGKSTLLNAFTYSDVTARDALFATLNPVSRRLRFPEEREVIITDTVGFIRELPPELMEAFKTTFEEIRPADLILHVMDASNPECDERYTTVKGLLSDLELDQKPVINVLNKADKTPEDTMARLVRKYEGIPISALDPSSLSSLLAAMQARLWPEEPVYAGAESGSGTESGEADAREDAV